MVAPPAVVTAANKVKRAFDVSTRRAGGGARQPRRRRGARPAPAAERRVDAPSSPESSKRHGLPPAGPAVGELPLRRRPATTPARCSRRCLAEGVIVRPLHGFGAPTAIRVTVGTADENEFFADALARARRRRRGALASRPVRCPDPRSPAATCCARRRASGSSSLDAGLGARHLARGDRARGRRLRPNRLGRVGERAADRRLPARRSRSASCSARSSTGSRASGCWSAPTSCAASSSSCSPFAVTPGQIVALALVAGVATGFARPAAYAGLPEPRLRRRPAARERSAAAGRAVDDHGRDAARRQPRRRLRAGPRLLAERGQLRRLGRAASSRSPRALLQQGERESRGPLARRRARASRLVLRSRPLLAVLVSWNLAMLTIASSTWPRSSSRRSRSTPATSASACSGRRAASAR